MCLSRVDETYDPPIEVIGFKIMSASVQNCTGDQGYVIPEGVWAVDPQAGLRNFYTSGFSRTTYPAGFHAFADANEAKRYSGYADLGYEVIRKVRLKAHTKGWQGAVVYVGSEIFLEEVVKV